MSETNTIVITKYKGELLVAVHNGNTFSSFCFYENDELPVGTIVLSRVENYVKSLEAYYVSLPGKKKGFLPSSDGIKQGDNIPVMIVKEGTETKSPIVSTELEMAGLYSVVFSMNGEITASKKLSKKEQRQLISLGLKYRNNGYRTLFRTNAAGRIEEDIANELIGLYEKMDEVVKNGPMKAKDSILFSPKKAYMKSVYDVKIDSLCRIVTDDSDVYEYIYNNYYLKLPDKDRERIDCTLFNDRLTTLDNVYSLSVSLENAVNCRVWLKSGGFLIIEKTEALVSIDVNSGKNIEKKNREETFFNTNMEAAEEIAFQLKLRNLSGIIIVDFINMSKDEYKKELCEKIEEELKNDKCMARFHGMTALGLAEITRTKTTVSLSEQLMRINRKRKK